MGAISGVFHPATPKPLDPSRIRRMIEVQSHRGPDGEGVWTAPGVGLGHRRLAAVDLIDAPQPMVDDALAVTLDGTIHNAADLRAELQATGARFRTRGAAEILLHGWRAWGPAMLERLNGEFAFAIHDRAAATLFLARDRLGARPLHYAELPDGALAFASELKGLLAHPLLRRVPDVTAVEDFLAHGYVPDDACIVAGVRKLAAGHWLLVERGRPIPAPRRWWEVYFSTRARGSADVLAEELVERMRAAVRCRMAADVPPGALLTGGVDSAAVVALMAEASPRAVATCTIHTDADRATRDIAARFATDHAERVIDRDDVSLIDTIVHHFDEPFADPAAIPALQACAFARQRMAVALTGDGADEMMAGHRRHRAHVVQEHARRVLPDRLRTAVFGALGTHWPDADWTPRPLRVGATLAALGMSGAEAYAHAAALTPPALRRGLLSDAARRAIGGHRAEDRIVAAMAAAPARDPLDAAQYADLTIRLPGHVLTMADRTGMAVGLETRAPLLDHHLVAFAATLPASMRRRGGEGKWLMKRGLERHLPRDMLYARGTPPVARVDAWFRGRLAGEAAALARSGTLADTGWFDPVRLARLADDHCSGCADHGHTLWQLLMLAKSIERLFG